MNWVKSIISGTPDLGWENTIAFLSLPLILLISQTASQKILQPPKDPNKVYTDQELATQGFVNNLPFIVAFFSLNVPAGLAIYWVINNIATTLITVSVKANIKDEGMPPEVDEIMAMVERGGGAAAVAGMPRGPSQAQQEFRGPQVVDDRPKSTTGFSSGGGGSVVDVDFTVPSAVDQATDAAAGSGDDSVSVSEDMIGSGGVDETTSSSSSSAAAAAAVAETNPKRKKREKPAAKKKKGKK